MRQKLFRMTLGGICLVGLLAGSLPAQYREYFVYGKVEDQNRTPLEKVDLDIRDTMTSRKFSFSTDQKGEYKLVGIPHGVYDVVFSKEGYRSQNVRWDLAAPQERMQKVEMQPVILVAEETIRMIEEAREAEARFNEASEKIRSGDFNGALEVLEEMMAADPDDANALYLAGISYLRMDLPQQAAAVLEKVISLKPEFGAAYHQMGVAEERLGNPDKALEFYLKAIELSPQIPESVYNAGLILFGQSRIPEALAQFEAALRSSPDDPDFLEMAARCFIHEGDLNRALDYLEKARQHQNDPEKAAFLEDLITKIREQIKK